MQDYDQQNATVQFRDGYQLIQQFTDNIANMLNNKVQALQVDVTSSYLYLYYWWPDKAFICM